MVVVWNYNYSEVKRQKTDRMECEREWTGSFALCSPVNMKPFVYEQRLSLIQLDQLFNSIPNTGGSHVRCSDMVSLQWWRRLE